MLGSAATCGCAKSMITNRYLAQYAQKCNLRRAPSPRKWGVPDGPGWRLRNAAEKTLCSANTAAKTKQRTPARGTIFAPRIAATSTAGFVSGCAMNAIRSPRACGAKRDEARIQSRRPALVYALGQDPQGRAKPHRPGAGQGPLGQALAGGAQGPGRPAAALPALPAREGAPLLS